MCDVKFVYFPVRGRAEIIRLLLHAGGIHYEEDTVQFQDWPDRKEDTPYLTLPVLYWDGEELGQSQAIARFLAKQTNLAGDNELEQAWSEAMFDHSVEFIKAFYDLQGIQDEEEKFRKVVEFRDKTLPWYLHTTERRLKKAGGRHNFVSGGGSMTLGDLAVFNALDLVSNPAIAGRVGLGDVHDEILSKMGEYGRVTGLHGRVKSMPRVMNYIKHRPNYPF